MLIYSYWYGFVRKFDLIDVIWNWWGVEEGFFVVLCIYVEKDDWKWVVVEYILFYKLL